MAAPTGSTRLLNFEQLLHDGIMAAKTERLNLAYSLLNQAAQLNPTDARPYIWLAEISDDPDEKIEHLEKAVVLDPSNSAARRELALLTGKLDPQTTLPVGHNGPAIQPGGQVEAQTQSFMCAQCGGRLSYDVSHGGLACPYCGFVMPAETAEDPGSLADQSEQVLDFVLPTESGHGWGNAQQRTTCQQCGAVTILPPGLKSAECSYCGSNQFVVSTSEEEILDPQVIVLMKQDARQVASQVRLWLGKGLLTPDDLLKAVKRIRLRPAYYSCWTFDGTVEVRWVCEVKEGNGRYATWVGREGVEASFFNDILVPGVQAVEQVGLESVAPFDLKDVVEFDPDYLAGWPTLIYNRSLAEASLKARELVTRKIRSELNNRVEVGREKRNLQTRGSGWSGMTFKHVLLPLWTGVYHYKGKDYRLLINGQTGKVGGEKPTDRIKVTFGFLTVWVALFLVAWVVYWFWTH